jgi:NADP-dependent 3-hydroxy acid dehydrogenase YdfG
MGRLEGLVTLISGAAAGIGEGIARAFISEGAIVVLTDIRDGEGEHLARNLGHSALYRRLDVRQEPDWALVTEAVLEQYGDGCRGEQRRYHWL